MKQFVNKTRSRRAFTGKEGQNPPPGRHPFRVLLSVIRPLLRFLRSLPLFSLSRRLRPQFSVTYISPDSS